MARTPVARSRNSAAQDEESVLEMIGHGIADRIKKMIDAAMTPANRVADEAKKDAAEAKAQVEELRKEVDTLTARPLITRAGAEALLRGMDEELKKRAS